VPLAVASRPAIADWQNFRGARDGLADNQVFSILEDSDGALWFGTDQGAFRYASGAWTRFTHVDGLGDDIVTAILTDGLGRLWFGGRDLGLSRFDGRVWRQHRQLPDGAGAGGRLAPALLLGHFKCISSLSRSRGRDESFVTGAGSGWQAAVRGLQMLVIGHLN
jgi:streptogramin lyase